MCHGKGAAMAPTGGRAQAFSTTALAHSVSPKPCYERSLSRTPFGAGTGIARRQVALVARILYQKHAHRAAALQQGA
eukprot:12243557-Alexandrium_andersonii.AAC.1